MVKFRIEANEKEQRLDKFLKKYLRGASLSFVYKAIRKDVKVNGRRKKQDYILQEGDEVSLYISDQDLARFHPARIRPWAPPAPGAQPGHTEHHPAPGAQSTPPAPGAQPGHTEHHPAPGALPIHSAPGFAPGALQDHRAARPRKQFTIAYEDQHILIADKPPGLLTHGDRREKINHLANQVIAHLIAEGEYNPREKTFVPAPVNRLDRNTSGLVIFPKTYDALKVMNRLIAGHDNIRKFYLTIVAGELTEPLHLTGTMTRDESRNITLVHQTVPATPAAQAVCPTIGKKAAQAVCPSIGKKAAQAVCPTIDKKAAPATPAAKDMETWVEPLQTAGGYTLCRVEIRTGRTHQIRVQMAAAGYPLIGDAKYGDPAVNKALSREYGLTSQLLIAGELVFRDMPPGFEALEGKCVKAKIPKKFKEVMKALDFGGASI